VRSKLPFKTSATSDDVVRQINADVPHICDGLYSVTLAIRALARSNPSPRQINHLRRMFMHLSEAVVSQGVALDEIAAAVGRNK
jgi:hypothetical protein